MKLIAFIAGLILSIWVGVTVYGPVNDFVFGIKDVYLKSKTIERTVSKKGGEVVNTIVYGYREIVRIAGLKGAEEKTREEILTPTQAGKRDVIEKLFDYNIAFWVSLLCGVLTMSVYMNIIMLMVFFFKPITFLMK